MLQICQGCLGRGCEPLVKSLICCQCLPTVAHCCSVLSLPPIKDGLQQYEEGCDGRHVLALLGDANRLECFFNVFPVRFFF